MCKKVCENGVWRRASAWVVPLLRMITLPVRWCPNPARPTKNPSACLGLAWEFYTCLELSLQCAARQLFGPSHLSFSSSSYPASPWPRSSETTVSHHHTITTLKHQHKTPHHRPPNPPWPAQPPHSSPDNTSPSKAIPSMHQHQHRHQPNSPPSSV